MTLLTSLYRRLHRIALLTRALQLLTLAEGLVTDTRAEAAEAFAHTLLRFHALMDRVDVLDHRPQA